jgi:hypothetical protein
MILYHYCSVDKFLKILQSKCLWLTDLACANDYLEIKYGNQALLDHFSRITKSEPSSELKKFVVDANRVGYAFCMSESGDLLSQWRGYADSGKGVSIGFDSGLFNIEQQYPWYEAAEPIFGIEKVIYKELDLDKAILMSRTLRETINSFPNDISLTIDTISDLYRKYYPNGNFIDIYGNVCRNICPIAFYIKNNSFKEECEWRIIRRHPMDKTYSSNPVISEKIHKELGLDHFERDGLIIGFYKLDIKVTRPIKEVYLGPKCILNESDLFYTLSQLGFPNIRIKRSTSSLR